MASNKFFQNAVAAAATLSVAVLAGCPGTPTTPTPSGSASAKPSAPASTTPSGTPTSPASGSSASATPSAAPTSIPSTPDTSSRATVQGVVFDDTQQRLSDVTVTGKVLGAGTFANGSDTLTVSTQVGSYSLNGAPTGQTILITATKSGFTTRQQTIVPLSNLQGNTDQNRVDFGQKKDGTADKTFAMSDKPEVTSMTPQADATGVDPATSITLTFSEPVNTGDVEKAFQITGATAEYTLSNNGAAAAIIQYDYNPSKDVVKADGTPDTPFGLGGASNANKPAGAIYDQSAFTFAWSNSNQTMTATFRPGFKLPTDKDASKIPQYAVAFNNQIRDAAGSGARQLADGAFFRISPAQIGKYAFRFTVAADTTAPRLLGVTPLNASSQAPTAGRDAVRYQFSETMVLYPANLKNNKNSIPTAPTTDTNSALKPANLDAVIGTGVGSVTLSAGIAAGTIKATVNGTALADTPFNATEAQTLTDLKAKLEAATGGTWTVNAGAHSLTNAANTKDVVITTTGAGGITAAYTYDGAASAITVAPTDFGGANRTGGTVVAMVTAQSDPSDPTRATVIAEQGAANLFAVGDTVYGEVFNSVQDPAGNAVDTSSSANVRSGRAI